MRNEPGDQDYSETPPVSRCGHCGEPLLSKRRRARYCSREHKELAREARKRASDRLTTLRRNHPFADVSLAELHAQSRPPRPDIDAGHVDADLIKFSDEYDEDHQDDEQTARIPSMFDDEDQRTPRETWKLWRSYGRRHGTEDPAQAADRIQRHVAAERAADARRDANATGQVQSRFDQRTASSVVTRARESRALNLRHVERPPTHPQGYDFSRSAVNRQGTVSGQERYGGAAWQMQDGFIY
jgi:hypothetical protein